MIDKRVNVQEENKQAALEDTKGKTSFYSEGVFYYIYNFSSTFLVSTVYLGRILK